VKNSGLELAIEVVTSYQGKPNGNIRLARSAAKGPFSEAARVLIDAVAPHLGVALALVQALEASNAVRCDRLTGLLSRRAFLSEASRKYAAAARAGRGFALFVFDCDDSETMSEEALAAAGRALKSLCGEDDVVGVLDEDEFALATGCGSKLAEVGERICADLTEAARRFCPDVSISVGCAAAAAEADETLEDLLARAECALHAAKREGLRCVVSADASLKVTSCSSD
jgi:diguanylate cyclase (GGDEF)-like protein